MNANAPPSDKVPARSACEVTAGDCGLRRIPARRPPQYAGDKRKIVEARAIS